LLTSLATLIAALIGLARLIRGLIAIALGAVILGRTTLLAVAARHSPLVVLVLVSHLETPWLSAGRKGASAGCRIVRLVVLTSCLAFTAARHLCVPRRRCLSDSD
jgi:hypothetical protein